MQSKSKGPKKGTKVDTEPKGNRQAKYKGMVGTIFAKQLAIPSAGVPAGYMLTFPKPRRDQYLSDETFETALLHWAETFEVNLQLAGPGVNRIIPESELEFEDATGNS